MTTFTVEQLAALRRRHPLLARRLEAQGQTSDAGLVVGPVAADYRPHITSEPASLGGNSAPPVYSPTPIAALPAAQWPDWAVALGHFRQPADHGVGDTAQRLAAKAGGEYFKRLAQFFGVPCGCTRRQHEWNALYPY